MKQITSDQHNILVSIVTPNYNGSKFIAETIESVLSQDYDNIEYIIVDDGSTDNSLEIIKKIQHENPAKITVISQSNHGQSAAVNVGFKKARGEIVGWINSDDTYCHGAVSAIVNAYLSNNKKKQIIFGDLNIVDSHGKIIRAMRQLPLDITAGSLIGFGAVVASNTVFWKRELIDRVGYLREDFHYDMDGEYFSLLFRAAPTLHIKKFIANYRVHSASKAADKSLERERKMAFELDFERRKSYGMLEISKFWPYRFAFLLKWLFKAKRFALRTINR